MWHSLDKQGSIKVYDVAWPNAGIEVNIPADKLVEVKNSDILGEVHEGHGEQPESTPVSQRKYKPKKSKK